MKNQTKPNDSASPLSEDIVTRIELGHFQNAGQDSYMGLTKREYFAVMALQGMLSKYGTDYYQQHAHEAVGQADLLIEALNKEV